MPSNRVDQVDVPGVLRNHEERVKNLERFVNWWHYATPVAPATPPPNYSSADPLGVPFLNGWGNISGDQPFRYRIHPASRVEIMGALTGGTAPSIVCTLPGPELGFWPPNDVDVIFPATDGTAAWTGLIDTSGNVWVISQLTPGGGVGTILDITSDDGSITVTNPTGPVTDLSVVSGTLPPWFQYGSGSPAGSVTPYATGAVYQDTTNGALYEAVGATSADWVNAGGDGDFGVPGFTMSTGVSAYAIASGGGSAAVLTDVLAIAGSNNGVFWRTTGVDGAQQFAAQVGPSGSPLNFLLDDTGLLTTPAGISTAPAASSASTLALGTAYQNTLGYDIVLTVYLNITVNAGGSVLLGTDPTSSPTQQTLVTGVTALGIVPVSIYLPSNYYALLSLSGSITAAIIGQIAMPV